eukprot:3872866-Pleurochrysis_carterae.AAC.3
MHSSVLFKPLHNTSSRARGAVLVALPHTEALASHILLRDDMRSAWTLVSEASLASQAVGTADVQALSGIIYNQ